MFPTRLSEVAPSEVHSVIQDEVAETIDFELKRSLPDKKGGGVETKVWEGLWAMRVTARPFSPFVLANLPKQAWLKEIDTRAFDGTGQLRQLGWRDLRVTRTWLPRLRRVQREFEGTNSLGLDQVSSDGLIERFVWQKQPEKGRPRNGFLEIVEFHWNVASVIHSAAVIRAANSRPTQHFALEIEFMTSDPLLIFGYVSSPSAIIPPSSTTFPRYEIGDPETFDELMMTVDKDVWNLGGHHPSWELGVKWPEIK